MAERQRLGTVTVIPAQYAPNSNFYTFAEGPLAGAAKGAATEGSYGVLASGAAYAITVAMMPPAAAIAAPFVILGLTISTAITTVGVIVEGAMRGAAIPAEQAQQIKSFITEAVARLDAQHALAKRLDGNVKTNDWLRLQPAEAAGPKTTGEYPGYQSLSASGINVVLEGGVTEIGFDGCGKGFDQTMCPGGSDKPLVYLFMIARARLVRVSDGTTIYSNEFRYDSPPRELAEWAASNAEVFSEELELGYRDLAERINDELFLVTPITLPVPSYWLLPSDPNYLVCWLRPVYPEAEFRVMSAEGWKESFAVAFSSPLHNRLYLSPIMFTALDSRRPTLRWNTFPRDIDQEKLDPGILSRMRDVTYDLRIWEVVGASRGKLAYERTGLAEPQHQLESELKPNRRYFWSFRARFKYEGLPMATRWAFFRFMTCDREQIPAIIYYRFITPN